MSLPKISDVVMAGKQVDQIRERLGEALAERGCGIAYAELDLIMEVLLAGVKVVIEPSDLKVNFGNQLSLTAYNRQGDVITEENQDGPIQVDRIVPHIEGIDPLWIKSVKLPEISADDPNIFSFEATIIPFIGNPFLGMGQGGTNESPA